MQVVREVEQEGLIGDKNHVPLSILSPPKSQRDFVLLPGVAPKRAAPVKIRKSIASNPQRISSAVSISQTPIVKC